MPDSRLHKVVLALGLTAALTPLATQAQEREIVSKQISIGRAEATLLLEYDDEGTLEISLSDGTVAIDGEEAGRFDPGGTLDAAWRELLSRAVVLEDGPLSDALADWSPPTLSGSAGQAARSVDRALEESLAASRRAAVVTLPSGSADAALRTLLGSPTRLRLLGTALDGVGDDIRLHVGEDVEIEADETVESDLVVIDGDLRIRGDVEGHVVAVGGTVRIYDDASVEGSIRLVDARLLENDGSVDGPVVDVSVDASDAEAATAAEIEERVRDELEAERRADRREAARDAARSRADRGSPLTAPFRALARGVGGVLEIAFVVLVLALIGAAVVTFAGPNLETIAETARRSPGRSVLVGLAGTVFFLPAWLLGFVALMVSIVGIPVAIAWLPLFPLAACAAALLGYLAVARNTGEWLADSGYPWTGWIRKSNPLVALVGGLVGLTVLFAVEDVVSIAPFLGFFEVLVGMIAGILTFFAVQIGFGAVLLTRGGRRWDYRGSGYDAEEAWKAAMDMDVEEPKTDEPGKTGGEDGQA